MAGISRGDSRWSTWESCLVGAALEQTWLPGAVARCECCSCVCLKVPVVTRLVVTVLFVRRCRVFIYWVGDDWFSLGRFSHMWEYVLHALQSSSPRCG
jgi:hypothetical protein